MENNPYTNKVLVLGSDTRSFLSVVRSLGRKKIEVHVAWCAPDSPASYSRYIKTIHNIKKYDASDDEWIGRLINLLKNESYDLVIPCNDPSIIPLQYNRNELEKYAKLYLLEDDAFEICNSKIKTTELAESLGINIPRYTVVTHVDQVDTLGDEYSYPLVIKPVSSFDKNQLRKKLEVVKANNHKQLLNLTSRMLKAGKLQVQENFIGKGVGVEVLVDNGKVLTAFQHERVHEPMMGGGSSYRKSVAIDEELLIATKKLMTALKYTGVAMVEFKVDVSTNRWILIEINARFWGSLPLSVAAGIDFPYWLFQMLVHNKKEFPADFKNIYCRNTALDFEWFVSNVEADRNDPSLLTLPLSKVAMEVFNVLTFKERNDTLQVDDLRPGFVELRMLFNRIFGSVVNKIFILSKSSYPFRKYQAYRCARTLSRSRKILFVCYGNICRSPFAELYARNIFPDSCEIFSSGVHPVDNRSSPEIAVKTASDFNVQLIEHRSTLLSQDIVNQADVIFTFDDLHYEKLVNDYPLSVDRTFMISALNLRLPRETEDPYGKSSDNYIKIYSAIKTSLESIKERL